MGKISAAIVMSQLLSPLGHERLEAAMAAPDPSTLVMESDDDTSIFSLSIDECELCGLRKTTEPTVRIGSMHMSLNDYLKTTEEPNTPDTQMYFEPSPQIEVALVPKGETAAVYLAPRKGRHVRNPRTCTCRNVSKPHEKRTHANRRKLEITMTRRAKRQTAARLREAALANIV